MTTVCQENTANSVSTATTASHFAGLWVTGCSGRDQGRGGLRGFGSFGDDSFGGFFQAQFGGDAPAKFCLAEASIT